jgi:putative Ca2+/H+ antiporter (TMEM165/GDT1 family)
MVIPNVPAVLFGNKLIKRVPVKVFHMIAAALFIIIGVWVLASTGGWIGD